MPFQPGQSGNPGGSRPKELRVTTWIIKELDKLRKIEGYDEGVTYAQLLAEKIVLKAMSADLDSLHYIKEVLDRVEGKPIQGTDVTSNGETVTMHIFVPEKYQEPNARDNLES
jgi:hypothetical protein